MAKGYGFASFTETFSKYIGENVRKNLSSKCTQNNLLINCKQSVTDALKTASKRVT